MIITGAFFCEAARTYEQKLNVLGGVWDWLYVDDLGDGVDLNPTLVVLIQRESGEVGPSKAQLLVRDPEGTTVTRADIEYGAPPNTVLGFFHAAIQIRAKVYGRYVVELSTNVGMPTVVGLNIAQSEGNRTQSADTQA